MRTLKRVALGTLAATMVVALGASAASAAPAVWSAAGGAKVTGTLSVTSGGSSKTCTLNMAPTASNTGSPSQASLQSDWSQGGPCSPWGGQNLTISFMATGAKNGTAYSLTQVAGPVGFNPWSSPGGLYAFYNAAAWTVPFTNGTATVPSKITFSNTQIGAGQVNISATGTLNVTRTDGSLLKLL